MENTVGKPEIIEAENMNLEEKVHVCLLLDNSNSMQGSPIEALNEGVQEFFRDIENDDRMSQSIELSIVVFGTEAEVVQDPSLVDDITFVPLDGKGGYTALNEAIQKAFHQIDKRKEFYDEKGISSKRGWIVLLTDGAPTDGDVDDNAKIIEQDTLNARYCFMPIGVDGADMETLNKLAGYMESPAGEMIKISALPLSSTKFPEFFKWLSRSIRIDVGNPGQTAVVLPDPHEWMQDFIPKAS